MIAAARVAKADPAATLMYRREIVEWALQARHQPRVGNLRHLSPVISAGSTNTSHETRIGCGQKWPISGA